MALPSFPKRGCDEALWLKMGWGTLLFLFVLDFSSLHIDFFSDPTPQKEEPPLDLMIFD
jgi:hypothetical protein